MTPFCRPSPDIAKSKGILSDISMSTLQEYTVIKT